MKTFLVVTQVLYLASLPLWFVVWAMSSMMFDNGVDWRNVIGFSAITAYPVLVVASSIAAWVLHVKFDRRRAAVCINLIPILYVVAGILLILGILHLHL